MSAWVELPPWHEALFTRLTGLHRQGRLAHAYLLQGRPGLGKGLFARYLAQALLCHSPRAEHPCRACSACQLLVAGTHPDLREVRPDERRSSIVVDQVRETVEFLGKTAQIGARKVVLMNPAEAMNINAANALLKGLEEPAPGNLMLLVSQQGALLPATIRSRCQTLQFAAPPRDVAAAWLAAHTAGDQVESLLDLADGAPLRALALADEDVRRERTQLHESLQRLLAGEIGPLDAAANCATFSLTTNIEGMMLCVTDLLRHHQSGGRVPLKDRDLAVLATLAIPSTGGAVHAKAGAEGEGKAAAARAAGVIRALHALHGRLLEARRALAGNANPNAQLLMESLFVDWADLRNARGGLRLR